MNGDRSDAGSEMSLLRLMAQAAKAPADGLPADTIRFTLEMRPGGDLIAIRSALELLLTSPAFDLQPLADQLPAFAVLQFPGVRRTVAPPRLFAVASYLADELDLISCVPDIGSTLYAEPDARVLRDDVPESVITDTFCWSDAAAPTDLHWAVKKIGAVAAWSLPNGRGENILIAQPDTGVARHAELEAGALALDKAVNILDGSKDPTDPLRAGTANPGHGTATSSVVVSREQGVMTGSAPSAQVIPIRCIEDVKIFDGSPVARAILHAVSVDADVISMSLGGIYSPSIAAALQKAIAADCIVVVASGNCIGFVVYPASDRNSISLGGTDSVDRPWKGTSRGSRVDVSAPAENVYVARRTPGDDGKGTVSGGQGTSFATALTAGVAATWLSHFGRAQVRAEAKKRDMPLQELFRAALKCTVRVPSGWNKELNGAGIVDAQALLNLHLEDIPFPRATAEAVLVSELSEADRDVEEIFKSAEVRATNGFDWAMFGAEATFLAADERRRTDPTKAGLVESRVRPKPSPRLQATAPLVIRRVLERARNGPELVRPLDLPRYVARNRLRLLGKRPGEHESTVESARAYLSVEGRKSIRNHAEDVFSRLDAMPGMTLESAAARRSVVENSDRIIGDLATNGGSGLSSIDHADLEALVMLKGRPAIKITNGKFDDLSLKGSDWEGDFKVGPNELKSLAARVGRIDIDDSHVGTGFVVGNGLIMTNRHVAEAIADQVGTNWFVQGGVTINFDDRGEGDSNRFRIKSLLFAGADPINSKVDFKHLDLALFEADTSNGKNKFPGPISIVASTGTPSTKDVVVVGYPAKPDMGALEDPNTCEFRKDIAARLREIFGLEYGRKYLAPGRIETMFGKLPGDPSGWTFTHDCTTLAGNSGSLVSRFDGEFPALGLHFAGRTLTANFAHALGVVRTSGTIPPAVAERLSWIKDHGEG